MPDIVMRACHLSYLGSIKRRIDVQANPGINARSYSKNNEISWGMTQVVGSTRP
jgi:hypothetical protein